MNELIKITNNSAGQDVVSARELYNFLEVDTPMSIWIKRMFDYGFEEDKDFITILLESTGGRKQKDFALTLDTAKEISMIQRSEKGKLARRYFIECEKELRFFKTYQKIENKLVKSIKLENKKHQKNNIEPTDKILLNFMKNERELTMINTIEKLKKDLKKLTDACASNGIYL